MRLVTCKRCGHVWNFKGNAIYYTCCPRCRANVRLLNAVEIEVSDVLLGQTPQGKRRRVLEGVVDSQAHPLESPSSIIKKKVKKVKI